MQGQRQNVVLPAAWSGRFEMEKHLSSGGLGEVYRLRVLCEPSPPVAAKFVRREDRLPQQKLRMDAEVEWPGCPAPLESSNSQEFCDNIIGRLAWQGVVSTCSVGNCFDALSTRWNATVCRSSDTFTKASLVFGLRETTTDSWTLRFFGSLLCHGTHACS